ncbi:MAG TPA: CDP-diacylglycerol--glycerol-3-phosphate 3-phosphatidyltransferase [Arachnia sp.]|nr:CDP-diacylglycerol--glycerol-3-phosphate 3-phosphatidyltransferase [Arachnia sp.]HMR13687.1 CDP-diacylglycerol--glycerol-3-phosphate 3-phosphatidyltransferase [Arachnia sp.]
MTEKPRRAETASNWNVPNVLTVIRIILVPVYVVLLFTAPEGVRWAAAIVFVLAMLTDLADGYIARRYNLITDFGKIWDPIADKALTGAAFVSLSILTVQSGPELPWVFTIIILVREWGITWVREVLKRYGNVMAANKGGKAKTATQTFALILFSLGLQFLPGWLGVVAWALMWAALILTVVTGVDYLVGAWRIRRDALARRRAE